MNIINWWFSHEHLIKGFMAIAVGVYLPFAIVSLRKDYKDYDGS